MGGASAWGMAILLLCAAAMLGGCTGPSQSDDGPLPAFSGDVYEQTTSAMAEKDAGALPVSVIMNAYATPDGDIPSWSYLFASQKYAKFYTVFNYSTKAVATIYGATTWNLNDWEAMPSDTPSLVQIDADKAYRSVLAAYPAYADKPYRISFLVYEPEIERTEDAPEALTWYFYFTTEAALDKFDSSVENPNDIADAIFTVDAQTGDVFQKQ